MNMNKQYTKWVLRAMLPLTLAACQQEAVETETPVFQDLYTIQASVDNGAQGRAQIELNHPEVENERFYWNSGDEFTLFDLTDTENPVTSVFRISDSYNDASWGNPSSSASFSTNVPMTMGHSVTAVYPPVPQQKDGKVLLSLSQNCPNGNDDGWKDYMRRNMMMAAQTKVETNVRMNFQHLCAMFRISFINNTNSWLGVKKVTVKTDGNYISNQLSLDLSSLEVQPEAANEVSLTCDGSWGVNSRSSKDFYLLFFPGENFSESATLTVEMEMSNGMKLESAPRELKDLNAEGFKAGLRYWLSVIYTADQLVWKATVGEGMLTTPELVQAAVNAGATTNELGFVDMVDEANRQATQKVTSIRIRQADLSELKHFPNLEELDCNDSQLTSLDLSELSNLKRLYCNNNKLTSLDLKNVPSLEELNCGGNQLSELDLAAVPNLVALTCSSNPLPNLDFTQLVNLQVLDIDKTGLTSLEKVPTGLVALSCGNNPLSSFDFSAFTQLKKLDLSSLPMETLDLSHNLLLENLHLWSIYRVEQIDLSMLKNLKTLNLGYSGSLTGVLDLSENPLLEDLFVSGCRNLTGINLGTNTALKRYYADNMQLTELDLSGCPNLEYLNCSQSSQMTSVTLGEKPKLIEFYCNNNAHTSLDISGCPALQWFFCFGCALTEVDITQNPELRVMKVGQQQLDGTPLILTLKVLPEQKVQWENNWKNYTENAGVNPVVQDLGTTEGGSGGFDNWGSGGSF